MIAVPRGLRYRVAVTLARAVAPLIGRSANGRLQMTYHMDSAREIALHRVLEAMTLGGTAFDPQLVIEGGEVLDAALGDPNGILLVATHAVLTSLILRPLRDSGRTVTAITGEPIRIPGTGAKIGAIPPAAGHLFRVRSALRAGQVVGSMIDGEDMRGPRSLSVPAPSGAVHLAPELFRLASRCGARIIFVIGRLRGNDAVLSIGAPATAETAASDFAAFVRAHLPGKESAGR